MEQETETKEIPEMPPIPEEALTETKVSVMESFGLADWKPPGERRNKDNYEFFIFDKESKEQVFSGTDKDLMKELAKNYDPVNFWFIETVDRKIINKEEKFIKKYEQLIEKEKSKKKFRSTAASTELCYQLMVSYQNYIKAKETKEYSK